MTNDTNADETARPKISINDPGSVDWIAQSREYRILGEDKYEAGMTAHNMAQHETGYRDFEPPEENPDPKTAALGFEEGVEKGHVPATCADIVAGDIIAIYRDDLSENVRDYIRDIGELAVIKAADKLRDQREDDEHHRRFADVDLGTVAYGPLSKSERREYLREKARRIRQTREERGE